MAATLEVHDLSVVYRSFGARPVPALDSVTFAAEAGQILGILGPNGSGKSTLFAVLAGSLLPTSGQARVLGCDPTHAGLLARVGFQPEGPLPFRDATPRAFLRRFVDLFGLAAKPGRKRADDLLDRLGLGPVAQSRAVRRLSTGMARRLALAAALLPEPEVLLLDEPTAGLDPDGSLLVMDILRAHAKSGGTVLLASHHLLEIEDLCERVLLLDAGKVMASGTLEELLGTGETRLTVAGLPPEGIAHLQRTVVDAGGRVIACEPRREHLFAWFRRQRQRP